MICIDFSTISLVPVYSHGIVKFNVAIAIYSVTN